MRGPRLWRVAALVLAVAIVFGGVIPTHAALHAVVGDGENATTDAAHFLQYVALSFVLVVALAGWKATWRTLLGAGLACTMLGVGIELVQLALPYRSAQLSDALLDVAGTALGLAVVSWVARTREKR